MAATDQLRVPTALHLALRYECNMRLRDVQGQPGQLRLMSFYPAGNRTTIPRTADSQPIHCSYLAVADQ